MASLRILHLTDTHLFGDDARHYGVVDTAAHLRAALAHVADQPFDVAVCSGDVSEDGTTASYVRARELIGSWAAARGARAVFAMGNHDSRAEFRGVLGLGQPGAQEHALLQATGPGAPIASVATVGGWRTIVLDTSVPGFGYGELGEEQLEALSAVLETPAAHGTVLVMHHPPVAAQTDLLAALSLDAHSTRELWARLEHTDVRAILCGHYHHPIVETVGGIPVVVAPGVANIARGFGPAGEESAHDSFGGAVVELSLDRQRVLPFTEAATGREVFRYGEAEVGQIIAAAGRN